jgi:hypothetical protein
VLRYVKFHPKQPHCEHCNAGLLKGAVELSDGKKYGRDCAARAMGKPRESASMKKHVDDLRKQAIRNEQIRGWKVCRDKQSGWTWNGKGDGGSWPLVNHYLTQNGESVLEVRWDANVLCHVPEDKIIGYATDYSIYLAMTPEDVIKYEPRFQWTKVSYAQWVPNKGWDL